MAEMERSYIVSALIIILLMVVTVLIALKFYPDLFGEVNKIANDVFGIVPEEEQATLDAQDNFVKSVEECLSADFVRCGCKLKSRDLPEDYYLMVKNTPEGAVISLLSNENTIIGQQKLIPNAKIGMALHAYNSRGGIYSDSNINTVDSLCFYDKDIKLIGNSDNKISTQIGKDEGEFFADGSEQAWQATMQLHKISGNSLCLITSDLLQADIGDRGPFKIEDAASINEKELIYPTTEILQSGRYRGSESFSADNFNDISILTLNYLQSLSPCSGEIAYSWPTDASSATISSCSVDSLSDSSSGITYGIGVAENTEVIAPANSEVSGYCNDCPAGQKWVELKLPMGAANKFYKFRYSGLKEIKPEIIATRNLRVRKGQQIGTSSAKISLTTARPEGIALYPGCIFGTMAPQHYTGGCKCPSQKYDSCYMDSNNYFYHCWR